MFSGNQITTYVNIGIIAFYFLVIIVEMLFGLKRGWKRQLLHIACSFGALATAFFITEWAITSVKFDEQTVSDLILKLQGYGVPIDEGVESVLTSIDPELYQVVITLPLSTVLAPLIFTLLFFAANLVFKLIGLIVKIFIPKANGKAARFTGMAIGFVEGAIVAALVLLPVAAYSSMLDESVEAIDSTGSSVSEGVHSVYDEYLSPIGKNPVLGITELVGGGLMIDEFATVDFFGDEVNMRDEIVGAVKIAAGSEVFSTVNWEKLSASDKEHITSLVDSISKSEFFTHAFSGAFKTAAHFSEENDSALVADEADGDLVVELFKDTIGVLGSSTKDTVGEDLGTIKEMFFILSDGDVVSAFNGNVDTEIMIDVFNTKYGDETVLTALISTLRKNERTSPLIRTLSKLSLSVIGEDMGLGEDAEALYENVVTGLDEINAINPDDYATEDEYSAEVNKVISSTLEENGITLEPEILDDLTEHAMELQAKDGHVNEADIQDILVKYFDSYANNAGTVTP